MTTQLSLNLFAQVPPERSYRDVQVGDIVTLCRSPRWRTATRSGDHYAVMEDRFRVLQTVDRTAGNIRLALVDEDRHHSGDEDGFLWNDFDIATINGSAVNDSIWLKRKHREVAVKEEDRQPHLPKQIVSVGEVAVWNKQAYYSGSSDGYWLPVPIHEASDVPPGAIIKKPGGVWAYEFEGFDFQQKLVTCRFIGHRCFRHEFVADPFFQIRSDWARSIGLKAQYQ